MCLLYRILRAAEIHGIMTFFDNRIKNPNQMASGKVCRKGGSIHENSYTPRVLGPPSSMGTQRHLAGRQTPALEEINQLVPSIPRIH